LNVGLVGKYTREKLSEPNTYLVALVVGTLINAYGHILVPAMRGRKGVIENFVDELGEHPLLVASSIVLAYLFPICVGVYSAVRMRYSTRSFESRAEFPDRKPDPVFRAAPDGTIIDAGATTDEMIRQYNLARAQDFLGEDLWTSITKEEADSEASSATPTVHVAACDQWYLVSHSAAKDGAVNIYLTRISRPSA
jgi:hypothetical protein